MKRAHCFILLVAASIHAQGDNLLVVVPFAPLTYLPVSPVGK